MALLHCFVPRHFTVGYHRRHWGGTTEPSYARATAAGAFLHSPADLRTPHPLFVANRRIFRATIGKPPPAISAARSPSSRTAARPESSLGHGATGPHGADACEYHEPGGCITRPEP